jgi:hypothetical protein
LQIKLRRSLVMSLINTLHWQYQHASIEFVGSEYLPCGDCELKFHLGIVVLLLESVDADEFDARETDELEISEMNFEIYWAVASLLDVELLNAEWIENWQTELGIS